MLISIRWIAALLTSSSCMLMNASTATTLETEITMKQIVELMKSERWREALPYFNRLEAKSDELPESFYFYYLQALHNAKETPHVIRRSELYLTKFGANASHRSQVLEFAAAAGLDADRNSINVAQYFDALSRNRAANLAEYKLQGETTGKQFIGTAEKPSLGYIADSNGCHHRETKSTGKELYTWTGRCLDGLAEGWGQFADLNAPYLPAVIFLSGGAAEGKISLNYKNGDQYEGRWRNGELIGGAALVDGNGKLLYRIIEENGVRKKIKSE